MEFSGSVVGAWAVGGALLLSSVRAALLWRTSSRVDVVNAVVLGSLAEGRTRDLEAVLTHAGTGAYLPIARALCRAWQNFDATHDADLHKSLEREARRALLQATRRLRRWSWLDHGALLGILAAGLSPFTGAASGILALELVAATLLWLSNLYGARSQALRLVAGATALVESLVAAEQHLPTSRPTRAGKTTLA
jgi:hypothetical protein